MHQANTSESAIGIFKDYFIAGLALADNNFLLYSWNRLICQAVLTLNLMQTFNINQKLSAWE